MAFISRRRYLLLQKKRILLLSLLLRLRSHQIGYKIPQKSLPPALPKPVNKRKYQKRSTHIEPADEEAGGSTGSEPSARTLYRKRRSTSDVKKVRRWGTHPIWAARDKEGEYRSLVLAIKDNDVEYFERNTRMLPQSFDRLLSMVSHQLTKYCNGGKEPLSAGHRLAITLRFLAAGGSYSSVAQTFLVGLSTVQKIVRETCDILWEVLKEKYLKTPTAQDWKESADQYASLWDFPNCVGSVNGVHIVVNLPPQGTDPLVFLGVADAHCRFRLLDVSAEYGSASESGAFERSALCRSLDRDSLDLPEPSPIVDTPFQLPNVLVGGEAFNLRTNLMRPYSTDSVFNARLNLARRPIDCAMWTVFTRWRVFRKPVSMTQQNAAKVVRALAVMHNYLLAEGDSTYCPEGYLDSRDEGTVVEGKCRDARGECGSIRPLVLPPPSSSDLDDEAESVRSDFAKYFVSDSGAD